MPAENTKHLPTSLNNNMLATKKLHIVHHSARPFWIVFLLFKWFTGLFNYKSAKVETLRAMHFARFPPFLLSAVERALPHRWVMKSYSIPTNRNQELKEDIFYQEPLEGRKEHSQREGIMPFLLQGSTAGATWAASPGFDRQLTEQRRTTSHLLGKQLSSSSRTPKPKFGLTWTKWERTKTFNLFKY